MTVLDLMLKLIDKVTFTSYLVVVTTLGFFGLITLVIFHPPPAAVITVVFSLISAVCGYFGAIVQYKFGSSSGSTAKSETIKEALAKKDISA